MGCQSRFSLLCEKERLPQFQIIYPITLFLQKSLVREPINKINDNLGKSAVSAASREEAALNMSLML